MARGSARRWQITYVSGWQFTLSGALGCEVLAGTLVPFVLQGDHAVVLDPRVAVRDTFGCLVWDAHPLGPEDSE